MATEESAIATAPLFAVVEALIIVLEITEPVITAVAGTVTVAVILAGVDEALAPDAADPQELFWEVHSSAENPGPENETQALNWVAQADAAADSRSSNSSPKTVKDSPDLPTAGQRPPRDSMNSKKVSMTVIACLVAEPLFPEPLEDSLLVVLVASTTLTVVAVAPPTFADDVALRNGATPAVAEDTLLVDFAADCTSEVGADLASVVAADLTSELATEAAIELVAASLAVVL
jgi:hypothetical protein